jgi:FtsZ-binding cell division protein ZapB
VFSNQGIARELSKLDVLESKLNIYESLSREMLDKLENAVDKISESNQRIANILAKHDERIEQSIKTDELIIKMIDEVKDSNTKEHKSVLTRIESLETKLESVGRFRWLVVGGLIIISFIFSQPHIIVDILTPGQQSPRIESR